MQVSDDIPPPHTKANALRAAGDLSMHSPRVAGSFEPPRSEPADGAEEHIEIERFRDVQVEAGGQSRLAVSRTGKGGQRDRRKRPVLDARQIANLLNQPEAILARRFDVGDEDLEIPL